MYTRDVTFSRCSFVVSQCIRHLAYSVQSSLSVASSKASSYALSVRGVYSLCVRFLCSALCSLHTSDGLAVARWLTGCCSLLHVNVTHSHAQCPCFAATKAPRLYTLMIYEWSFHLPTDKNTKSNHNINKNIQILKETQREKWRERERENSFLSFQFFSFGSSTGTDVGSPLKWTSTSYLDSFRS